MDAEVAKRYAESKNRDRERVKAAQQAINDHVEGRGGFYVGTETATYLAVAAALNGGAQ